MSASISGRRCLVLFATIVAFLPHSAHAFHLGARKKKSPQRPLPQQHDDRSFVDVQKCRKLAFEYTVACHLDENVFKYTGPSLKETTKLLEKLRGELRALATPDDVELVDGGGLHRVWQLENNSPPKNFGGWCAGGEYGTGHFPVALVALREGRLATEPGGLLVHEDQAGEDVPPVFPPVANFFGLVPSGSSKGNPVNSWSELEPFLVAARSWGMCLSLRRKFVEGQCPATLYPSDPADGASGFDKTVSHAAAWAYMKTRWVENLFEGENNIDALVEGLVTRLRRVFKLRKIAEADGDVQAGISWGEGGSFAALGAEMGAGGESDENVDAGNVEVGEPPVEQAQHVVDREQHDVVDGSARADLEQHLEQELLQLEDFFLLGGDGEDEDASGDGPGENSRARVQAILDDLNGGGVRFLVSRKRRALKKRALQLLIDNDSQTRAATTEESVLKNFLQNFTDHVAKVFATEKPGFAKGQSAWKTLSKAVAAVSHQPSGSEDLREGAIAITLKKAHREHLRLRCRAAQNRATAAGFAKQYTTMMLPLEPKTLDAGNTIMKKFTFDSLEQTKFYEFKLGWMLDQQNDKRREYLRAWVNFLLLVSKGFPLEQFLSEGVPVGAVPFSDNASEVERQLDGAGIIFASELRTVIIQLGTLQERAAKTCSNRPLVKEAFFSFMEVSVSRLERLGRLQRSHRLSEEDRNAADRALIDSMDSLLEKTTFQNLVERFERGPLATFKEIVFGVLKEAYWNEDIGHAEREKIHSRLLELYRSCV